MIDIVYIRFKILIYLACEVQIALLLAKKISIFEEYAGFSNVFSKKSIAVLANFLNINEYTIDLKSDKQLPYKPIYSLGRVELEIF